MDMTWKRSADIWLASVAISPLFIVVHWGMAYVPYTFIFLSSVWTLFFIGSKRSGAPVLFVAQMLLLSFLAQHYFNDFQTLLNIAALIYTTLMFTALIYCIPNTGAAIFYIILNFRKYLLYLAVYGLVLSTLLSQFLQLDNPVIDLISGNRVRIFSKGYGHSPLIDIGVIVFFITLGMLSYARIRRDAALLLVSLLMVYFGRTSIGYLGIVGSVLIWTIENIRVGMHYKNLIYAVLFPALALGYYNYGNEVLLAFRTFQVGSRAITASGGENSDLSSGRTELNYYLARVVNQNPIYGAGVTNKIITDGIKNSNGQQVARVESPLRMGAKYGVFYLVLVFFMCIYSGFVVVLSDVRLRIIGLSLALYNLDCFLLNGLFETPHTWNNLALLFPTILLGEYARRSRSSAPAMHLTPQRVAA